MLLIDQDLSGGFDKGNQKSLAAQDRGALRYLTGEKVTRILFSLLNRYENQKDSILENTNIYEICGLSTWLLTLL